MNKRIWLVTAIALLFSCSSQDSATGVAAQYDCKITPDQVQQMTEEVCLEQAAHPEGINMGGYATDASMREQNAPPTMNVSIPIKMPNGDVAAEVLCEINMRHHAVIYARLTKGPTTKEEVDFLRAQGACETGAPS
jgi:hypothetical protein